MLWPMYRQQVPISIDYGAHRPPAHTFAPFLAVCCTAWGALVWVEGLAGLEDLGLFNGVYRVHGWSEGFAVLGNYFGLDCLGFAEDRAHRVEAVVAIFKADGKIRQLWQKSLIRLLNILLDPFTILEKIDVLFSHCVFKIFVDLYCHCQRWFHIL